MVAAVPVSLRVNVGRGGDTAADNQASMTLLSLGTNVADARKRMAHIKAATQSMKSTLSKREERAADRLSVDRHARGSPKRPRRSIGGPPNRTRFRSVANVAVSNVPGPPVPLYLAGARMLTNYPCSIVTHGMALNITVQSYAQSLDFGMMADAKAMPDVRKLAEAVHEAFDDLRALALHDDDMPLRPARKATRRTAVKPMAQPVAKRKA